MQRLLTWVSSQNVINTKKASVWSSVLSGVIIQSKDESKHTRKPQFFSSLHQRYQIRNVDTIQLLKWIALARAKIIEKTFLIFH